MLRKGSHKREEFFGTQHRFEQWCRDNAIYVDRDRVLQRALHLQSFLEIVHY